jgi:hypothetical protein
VGERRDHPPAGRSPHDLKQAAEFFGDARHAATLRVEIDRGNLVASKIGRAYWTTLPALNEMEAKCRVEAQARNSGSTKAANPGPSSTAEPAIAQGSAQRTLDKLKEHFGTTSTGKHKPAEGPNPLLADVLAAYAEEHLAHVVSGKHILYDIGHLNKWWGTKRSRTFLRRRAGPILLAECWRMCAAGTCFLNAPFSTGRRTTPR